MTTPEPSSSRTDAPPVRVWLKPLRNAGKLGLGRGIQVICSLGYLAFAARTLGTEGFGALVLIHGLALSVAQVARLEGGEVLIQYGVSALRTRDPALLHRLVNFALLLDVLGTLGAVLLFSVIIGPAGSWMELSAETQAMALPYGLAAVTAVNLAGSSPGMLRLFDRFGPLAVQTTLEPVLRLAGALILFQLEAGLAGFLWVWLGALLVRRAVSVWMAARVLASSGLGGGFRFSLGGAWRPGPGIWRFALHSQWNLTLKLTHRQIPVLVVGGLTAAAGAGLFRTAQQFADLFVRSVGHLLLPAVYPEMARLTAEGEHQRRRELTWKMTAIAVLALSPVCLLLIILGPVLIEWLMGAAFVGAYPVMVWLVVAGLLYAASFALEPLLVAAGRIRHVTRVGTLATLLFVALLFILLEEFGVEGAGMATLAYTFFRAVGLVWCARACLR